MIKKPTSLKSKITWSYIIAGVLPAFVIVMVNLVTLSSLKDSYNSKFQNYAESIRDTINRNLFERYGDVQAFGYNDVIFDKSTWYKNSADNKISKIMNQYIQAYGFYYLTILVDTSGKVIAVNDIDSNGKSIDTAWIYNQEFSDASWFKDAISGKFYTDNGLLSGTVIEDFIISDEVKKVYNDEGYSIGFSAPVKDKTGNVIAVWKNYAKFSLVEDIVKFYYSKIKADQGKVEVDILGQNGAYLVNYNDKTTDSNGNYSRKSSIINKEKISKVNLELINKVSSGAGLQIHEDDNDNYLAGFSQNQSVLGFKGMPWMVLVRSPESIVFASNRSTQIILTVSLLVTVVCLIIFSKPLVSKIITPIESAMRKLRETTHTLYKQSNDISDHAFSLSQDATEQSTAIFQTIGMFNGLSNLISTTTSTCAESNKISDNMIQKVNQSEESISKLFMSVDDINETSKDLMDILHIISDISAKTNVINKIVNKTQILSFNAAIEAERAGPYGRGFSVVAEEVGNLARMSGSAAKEIQELLDNSVDKVKLTVSTIQNKISEGKSFSSETGEAFIEMKRNIDFVIGKMRSIANEMNEQNSEVQQTFNVINEMQVVADKTKTSAVNSTKYAETLNKECNALESIIENFNDFVYGGDRNTLN